VTAADIATEQDIENMAVPLRSEMAELRGEMAVQALLGRRWCEPVVVSRG
jgi:hypothetical protein